MTERYSPETLDHSLQDGCIVILNVIDPFTYSIRCQDCLSSEELNFELKQIIPECIPLKRDSVIKPNSLVIVEESDGKYFRGYLKNREGQSIFYINRIDIGDEVCIQPCKIYYLPESLFNLEAQRHTIKLYGAIPCPEVTCDQLGDCYSLLTNLINNSTNSILNDVYRIGKFYYGAIDVVTEYKNKLSNISLKDILIEKRIALSSDNFTRDIIAINTKNSEKGATEHSSVEKAAESLRNIEITPQHSLYLNALTSGLLINPESFTDYLLDSNSPLSKIPTMEPAENKCVENKRKEAELAEAKLREFSGIGHGRPLTVPPNQDGPSGGRGRIKSLLLNQNDNKKLVESPVQPQGSTPKSGFSECAFSEKHKSSTKPTIDHSEVNSDLVVSESLKSKQADEVCPEKVIYSQNEANKNARYEKLCSHLLKNKKSNSDSRNKKGKDLHQSRKSKAHNYPVVSYSPTKSYDEDQNQFTPQVPANSSPLASNTFPPVNQFDQVPVNSSPLASNTFSPVNQFDQVPVKSSPLAGNTFSPVNQFDQVPVNSSPLASNKFSPVNKTFITKQESDQLEYESSPFKSFGRGIMIKSIIESNTANTDVEIKKEESDNFLCESPKALSLRETINPVLNSPVVNEDKTHGNIKSMGRGLLLNKFHSDLVSLSKPECLQEPKVINDLPTRDSQFDESFQKSNFNNDLPEEKESESPTKSDDCNDSPGECNPEVVQKSKDEPDIIKDLNDHNDHEDRYFEIEEPTYLNSSKDYDPFDNDKETKQNVAKYDDENYEKLLSSAPNEHEPLDDKSFVNPPGITEAEGELLEKQILRDYSIGQIPERMKMSCGLIHGNVIANPVSKLSDLKLEQHVFSNLNAKNMRELSRSQMFAVPVLLQRRNLILVGPPNSGKTLAFVMSLLSLLHDNDYYSSLKPGNGPRCIFVSSCAQNVNYISQFCSAICGAKLTIITTHGGGLELERKEDLTNGCEILVTTPRCLLRLLKHTSVTNLFRVCHIVFDDVDTLLSIFCPEIQEIMNNLNKMLQIRKRYCSLGIQVALVGEKWTPVLEEITFKALDSPVLCITAHLEAALYARIKPITYILSPDNKIKKLKELLDCTLNKIRTVIVCKSADEVKLLRPLLELSMSNVLVAHEEMGLNQLIEVADLWIRCASPPILLCSDQILNELAVTNAQWLIHYSMPDNKSSFSERFSTIKEHLYDRIKYPKTAPPECQVHILVDDTNELQFPEIISFMKRLNTTIPDVFLEAVKKISILKEEKKIDMPFCKNLLMFGHCWKKEKCKWQHIFNKTRDVSENLPSKGIMKVKLLYAHNPSHYSIRVLAMRNNDTDDEQWAEFPSNYALIAFKMSNYFSFRENRFAHGRVKIGDLVAIEVEPDLMFKRAKVIDIITRDDKYNPEQVLVHFIDEGSVEKLTSAQLLHLPPELQVYPQEAYDLYLLGLQPVDYDKSWSFASTLKIQKSISDLKFQDGDNKFFTANVSLVAGKNLLATSFLCYEWLDLNKCHIVLFSPKKFILDIGLAEPNHKHFSTLMNLALDAGLISSIPEEVKKSDADEEIEIVQWAHLDKKNTNIVHVISSDSPSLFFLKLFKFADSLEQLEKELTALLESKVTKLEVIEYNTICAAKNPNCNRWNRVIINDVNKDDVEVFFVDYGDCLVLPLSSLSRLPKGYITRLPFQAIECSLVGILPLDDDWLPQAVEAFDNMCVNDEYQLISMFAKVCDVKTTKVTNGRHFKVILAPMDKKDIYINKEMVFRGFANWDVETKHHLTETIVWTEDTTGDDEEDEFWNCNKEVTPDENIKSDDKPSQATSEAVASTSAEENQIDIMAILANGDFELGNSECFIKLLPPEFQQRIKEQRLKKINKENVAKSKDLKAITDKPEGEEEEEDAESSKIAEGPLLESCGILHPKVYWSQGDCFIRIKVNLNDIEKYQLDYSDQVVRFSALANEKYYWFEIVLFGLIIKESVTYGSKGLYFEIKMEKFVKGESWPRLVYDDFKFPWIKIDPDFIEQDDLDLIDSMFKKGLKFREEETHANPDTESLGVPEPDSDLESVSSRSENEEFTDLLHDSDNPESD